ncbi:hypothetical protein GA0061099_1005417 [Bradyrhizobium yuanmingense]|uniref:Uncharacterized protein n=1 Tax=Bradyrhizobium yuanmingense TaxID=108015 RepID=A0A1C3W854_9BRAD|nr:hypothetical protein [Bradyrhizobium yuanmingense]TWI27372.1 hypothetical protein IQ15_02907 [Bradyrhizobium yuanmingense]SCB36056.1 hypothetical protein GA0061099_1005417 [Bradyrhizobium yuanmingense]
MTPANDNGPILADDFADLAARRAWLASAPSTHATHREVSPVETWAKRQGDPETFLGLRLWRTLNEPPRLAANDNEPEEENEEEGEHPVAANLDREMVDVSAKQLIYAHEHGMTRWVGNRLVKVWSGHQWTTPDAEFGKVRQRKSEKADTESWDAEMPDAQAELARVLDTEKLRARLGHKVTRILDMAAGDSSLADIGEDLGFAGQYAARMAAKEVRAAVAALNTAMAEGERVAA